MSLDKKEHIIEVAVELFADKGFEGTSIREIAAKANVNIAMVNYYFGSKEALFEAMVEQRIGAMRDRMEALANDRELSEIEKIDAIIDSYVEQFLSNPNYHKVIQQEMAFTQREIMHEKALDLFIQNTKLFSHIIEKGIRKKMFRKVDAPLVFASIIGTIHQALKSKKVCNVFLLKNENSDPYKDEHLQKRLVTHIKQIIHSHLLLN